MKRVSGILLARLVLTFFCLPICGAETGNWPQFRGPQASGLDRSKALPTTWNVEKNENVAWRTPVAGLSHAAPIIWGDRVYVTTAVGPGQSELRVGLYGDIGAAEDNGPQTWRVLAIEKKTGKILWDKVGHEGVPRVKRHTKATHNNSTPATDGERIVTIFGSEGLFCFDTKGELVWKKDLGPMDSGFFAVKSAQWGFASSPVIHEGRVIVQCDVQTNSFLAAFDVKDGRELWRTPRIDVPTWSTPTVVQTGERTQILVNGWHHTGGYDFATGKEIWKLDGGGDIPVPTPIVGEGLAYFTSAHGRWRPMMAIRLDAEADITPDQFAQVNTGIAWIHPREGSYMQTPILIGENLFGCTDNGVLTCFDAKTGKIHYSQRLATGNQGFTASPVSDGRHIYFSSETGNVFVVRAGTEFATVSTNSLGETCMATPAISDGSLFFRTRGHLVSVREK
jgi:outer membrane protein assembly factor BamB